MEVYSGREDIVWRQILSYSRMRTEQQTGLERELDAGYCLDRYISIATELELSPPCQE